MQPNQNLRQLKIIFIFAISKQRQQQKPNVVKTNCANLNAITRNKINML